MANRGIASASLNTVVSPADRQLLSSASAPIGGSLDLVKPTIATLTKFETKCLLIQLAQLESNSNPALVSPGVPNLGIFKATINANILISDSNVATITITNSNHSDIKLGMIAQTLTQSTGKLGSNTMVIAKSVAGNIAAGNFIPGCTYIISSIGTTDFKTIGHDGNVTVVGNVFTANAAGAGTGTALGNDNQIVLGSNHSVDGAIVFNVSPLKLGKYQNSQWFLTRYGYLENSGVWKNKDGIDTNEVFLSATDAQDTILIEFIQEQYVELIKAGALRPNDDKETVAGMLAVAYQYQDLGNPQLHENLYNSNGTINHEVYSIASKANVWRETGQTVDSTNRPGHIYFNAGRYAIRSLGADVPE